MQPALFQQATNLQIEPRANRVLPGHGTGVEDLAVNSEIYHDENSRLRLLFSVLGHVIGGTILLFGLFVLPHVIARILA